MSDFTPTPEQLAIVEAAKDTQDNLAVVALAGAAKTSTLVLIAEALRNTPMLCLAFNKAIQVEMQERLPSTAVASTLNSLGFKAWREATRVRFALNKSKTYDLVKDYIEEKLNKNEQDEAYEYLSDIIRAIDAGKSAGYIPDKRFEHAKPLVGNDDFFQRLEEEPTPLAERIIHDVTVDSIHLAFRSTIDFNDQILMPTVFPATFPQYPVVLIDEAQDLSSLNHMMLRKIAKKRIIAVGDPCQAIYGFRGAHQDSMELLQKQFSMRELQLTVSFRCPRAVVRDALWRAPAMKYPDWAIEGTVETRDEWRADDVPDGAAIICRNNAPLFSLGIKLLKQGRYPQIKGNEIGATLVKQMKKFGPANMPRLEVVEEIEKWRKKKALSYRNPAKAHDMADCMLIFAGNGDTLSDIMAYAEHLFNSRGPIHMMTGHKAKGLEYNTVFFLDEHLISDRNQDPNVRYVIQTRAMKELVYVTSEGFDEETDEEDKEKAILRKEEYHA